MTETVYKQIQQQITEADSTDLQAIIEHCEKQQKHLIDILAEWHMLKLQAKEKLLLESEDNECK